MINCADFDGYRRGPVRRESRVIAAFHTSAQVPRILDRLDLPEDDARRLMELGFLPGHAITPGHSAPGGDPRVFRVDGSEVALRRDTARRLILRQGTAAKV